jgi:hypothetical protein
MSWLNLHPQIQQALVSVLREQRLKTGPSLCCQVDGENRCVATREIVARIAEWRSPVVLMSPTSSDRGPWRLVEMSALPRLLDQAVQSEVVVAVIDLGTLSGCTVDFDVNEDGTLGFLVAAHGAHEAMAELLASKFSGAAIFRGN